MSLKHEEGADVLKESRPVKPGLTSFLFSIIHLPGLLEALAQPGHNKFFRSTISGVHLFSYFFLFSSCSVDTLQSQEYFPNQQ